MKKGFFKEERKNLTVKGLNWDEETRADYTKQNLDIFHEQKLELKPTDMYIGQNNNGEKFYQLLDTDSKTYINVPSMDVEFFGTLDDAHINELITGKHVVTAKEHTSKKSGRKYYELIIE